MQAEPMLHSRAMTGNLSRRSAVTMLVRTPHIRWTFTHSCCCRLLDSCGRWSSPISPSRYRSRYSSVRDGGQGPALIPQAHRF